MIFDLRYVHDNRPVAEGERSITYEAGRLYVRTGVKGFDPVLGEITYRLREVYDAARGTPTKAPISGVATMIAEAP